MIQVDTKRKKIDARNAEIVAQLVRTLNEAVADLTTSRYEDTHGTISLSVMFDYEGRLHHPDGKIVSHMRPITLNRGSHPPT